MTFIQELKRRNVFRVGIAYLALAWLLIEAADTLFPGFGIPDWAFRFVVIVLALGFLPVLLFSWAYEMTPEGIKRDKDVVRDEATETHTAKRLDTLTITLVVVALVFVGVDRLWLGQRTLPATDTTSMVPETSEPEEIAPDLPPNSIAVLPFANRSDNPKDVFFVDGIHDDLLTFISQIGSIKTISRTSVMKYRDSNLSIPEIARQLAVATVLEGGVQRAGDQVRINVQLIDAATDDHLWSQIYDRQLTASNVFAIQSEIAGSIADALRAELTSETQERISRVPTENLQALEAYFTGRQNMSTRRVGDLANAIESLEQAVALDPQFALAHASLALAVALYWNYSDLPGEELLHKGQANAERALQLDPKMAEGHTATGLVKWYRGDVEAAEAAFRRAIQLNPNEAQAFQWLGRIIAISLSRIDEGIPYSRRAIELDPKSAIMIADYGDVLARAGKPDEALAQYHQAVAIEPRFAKGHRLIGDLLAYLGRAGQAIPAYRKALEIEPDFWFMQARLAALFLDLGDLDQADAWLSLAREQAPQNPTLIDTLTGRLYLYRGETARARERFTSALQSDPDNSPARYHLVNIGLAEGDIEGALAQYEMAFSGWSEDMPAFASQNHINAVHLAAVLSLAGKKEQMSELLNATWQAVDSYDPRHHSDDAAIHALRDDHPMALEALGSMPPGERLLAWRDYVVGHPAFRALLDHPEFQALDEQARAERARQLKEALSPPEPNGE